MSTARADVAQMLRDGATYERVEAELRVGSRVITRTRRVLQIPEPRGAGHRLPPDERARVHARIAELLHTTTATYDEIATQTGVSPHTVFRVRAQRDIARPLRPSLALTPEQAYAKHARPCEDGHARWAGSWAGRMPQIQHIGPPGRRSDGRKESALRVAFRMTHGREPVGQVRRGCRTPWCVAGPHLTDRLLRTQRTITPGTAPVSLDDAIARMLRAGATYAQIRAELSVVNARIGRVRREQQIPVPPGRPRGGRLEPADAVARLIEPYGDGHARWTGLRTDSGHAVIWLGPKKRSAPKIAFAAHHGREPVGQVRINRTACDEPDCIAGAHLADRIIRTADTVYASLLGSPQ